MQQFALVEILLLLFNASVYQHSYINQSCFVQLLIFHYYIWYPSLYHMICLPTISLRFGFSAQVLAGDYTTFQLLCIYTYGLLRLVYNFIHFIISLLYTLLRLFYYIHSKYKMLSCPLFHTVCTLMSLLVFQYVLFLHLVGSARSWAVVNIPSSLSSCIHSLIYM